MKYMLYRVLEPDLALLGCLVSSLYTVYTLLKGFHTYQDCAILRTSLHTNVHWGVWQCYKKG